MRRLPAAANAGFGIQPWRPAEVILASFRGDTLANHQIALPVTDGFAAVHVFGTVMDGTATGNDITCPAPLATASFSPLPRQQFP